jgi:hypothetical protein
VAPGRGGTLGAALVQVLLALAEAAYALQHWRRCSEVRDFIRRLPKDGHAALAVDYQLAVLVFCLPATLLDGFLLRSVGRAVFCAPSAGYADYVESRTAATDLTGGLADRGGSPTSHGTTGWPPPGLQVGGSFRV